MNVDGQHTPVDESRRKRILVVDDDDGVCDMLRGILTSGGYEVVVAASGDHALALLDREAYDVILADIYISDMNGLELIRHATTSHPAVAVMAISGSDKMSASLLLKSGASSFLPEPFSTRMLLNRLRMIFRKKEVARGAGV